MFAPLIVTLMLLNTGSQQQFIAALYQKQDYYQCIAELRRYQIMTGADMDYSIAYCYYKGNRLNEAALTLHQKTNKEIQHYLLLANVYTSLGQYSDALHTLFMCDSNRDPQLQMLIYKNILAVHVACYDWDAAMAFYSSHSDVLKPMQEMFVLLNNAKRETLHPYIAAGISAIVPGAGHLYARHYSDGIISALTIAVLAGATYISYTKGYTGLAYTFGALTVIGYGGNIYSAYRSAIHYNELLHSNYRTKIWNEYLHYNPEQFLPQWMQQ